MKKTSPILVVIAWAVVSIPLAWGIYNTGLNAAKLFTVGAPIAPAPNIATAPAK
jgi:hypothetical protein